MLAQDFIPRIRAAGFTLEVDGADIVVRPFSKLSEPQKAFIRQHKAEILQAMRAANDPAPLTADEESAVRRWLASIEEHDENVIGEVLDKCRRNPETREYFLKLAGKVPAVADRRPMK
jgi:hypothetical protein